MKTQKMREWGIPLVISALGSIVAYWTLRLGTFVGNLRLSGDTLTVVSLIVFLVSVLFVYVRYVNRSTKMRLDLLFRMAYQGPFVMQMRNDEEERENYEKSILRKIHSVGEYYRRFGDINFSSYYLGCLAFYANSNRANVSWEKFKEAVLSDFLEEILEGKIESHVIDEHYKGKWSDLIDEAKKKRAAQRVA